jgi:hypothetical protein
MYSCFVTGGLAVSLNQLPNCLKILSDIETPSLIAADARRKLANFTGTGASISKIRTIEPATNTDKESEEFDWEVKKKK